MIDFILTFLKVFVRITARNTFGTHHLCRITQDNNGNLTRVKYFRENQTKKRNHTSIILVLGFKDDFNSDASQLYSLRFQKRTCILKELIIHHSKCKKLFQFIKKRNEERQNRSHNVFCDVIMQLSIYTSHSHNSDIKVSICFVHFRLHLNNIAKKLGNVQKIIFFWNT